jgi:uncharacterized membrane protein
MNHRPFDLAVVVILAVVAMGLALTGMSYGALQVVFGLPLVLVLPGYALTAALFSKNALRFLERVVFSLGLSLVIAVLGGFVLNWTTEGLQMSSWAVLLGGVTLVASSAALVRRSRETGKEFTISRSEIKIDWARAALFGLAALIVVGAVLVARVGALQQADRSTQLWMLPANGAGQNVVRLGVRNMESKAMKYKLQVTIGNDVFREWEMVELDPEQIWETTIELPTGTEKGAVQAKLYLPDQPASPYRWVKQ